MAAPAMRTRINLALRTIRRASPHHFSEFSSSSSSSSSLFSFPPFASPSPNSRVSSNSSSPSISRLYTHVRFSSVRLSSSIAAVEASSTSSSSTEDLAITDNCVKRLQQINQEEGERKMLRVSVEGGGCSGFQYSFTLEDKVKTDDRVFEKDGVKVVVDELSHSFLKGATIDYVAELIRSSFMVTENPNASGGCGCGSSFMLK